MVIVALKGALMFATDLMRHLSMPCQVECIRVGSYGDGQASSGQVQMLDLTLPNLSGEDVLVLEDIVDTGLTLHALLETLQARHQPRSLRLAVLLVRKPADRKTSPWIFAALILTISLSWDTDWIWRGITGTSRLLGWCHP